MDINNFLAVLNDKLKSGDVEDVKKDSVVAGKRYQPLI